MHILGSRSRGRSADVPFFFVATAARVDGDFFLSGAVAGAKVGLVPHRSPRAWPRMVQGWPGLGLGSLAAAIHPLEARPLEA
jgi:hypothetical protein